jgi:hypothetical protein
MDREAHSIAAHLANNETAKAADQLNYDLYQLRGDIYAQDSLLSEVSKLAREGNGEQLQLSKWNPDRGTWDDIEITSRDGQPLVQLKTFRPDDGMNKYGEYWFNDRGQIDCYSTAAGDNFFFKYDTAGKVVESTRVSSEKDGAQQTTLARGEGRLWTFTHADGSSESVDLGSAGIVVDRNGPHLPSTSRRINEQTGIPVTPREQTYDPDEEN